MKCDTHVYNAPCTTLNVSNIVLEPERLSFICVTSYASQFVNNITS